MWAVFIFEWAFLALAGAKTCERLSNRTLAPVVVLFHATEACFKLENEVVVLEPISVYGMKLVLGSTSTASFVGGPGVGRLFTVTSGATLNLTNLAITGAHNGVLAVAGTLVMLRVTISENSAPYGGAAVLVLSRGLASVNDVTFSNNTVSNGAGTSVAIVPTGQFLSQSSIFTGSLPFREPVVHVPPGARYVQTGDSFEDCPAGFNRVVRTTACTWCPSPVDCPRSRQPGGTRLLTAGCSDASRRGELCSMCAPGLWRVGGTCLECGLFAVLRRILSLSLLWLVGAAVAGAGKALCKTSLQRATSRTIPSTYLLRFAEWFINPAAGIDAPLVSTWLVVIEHFQLIAIVPLGVFFLLPASVAFPRDNELTTAGTVGESPAASWQEAFVLAAGEFLRMFPGMGFAHYLLDPACSQHGGFGSGGGSNTSQTALGGCLIALGPLCFIAVYFEVRSKLDMVQNNPKEAHESKQSGVIWHRLVSAPLAFAAASWAVGSFKVAGDGNRLIVRPNFPLVGLVGDTDPSFPPSTDIEDPFVVAVTSAAGALLLLWLLRAPLFEALDVLSLMQEEATYDVKDTALRLISREVAAPFIRARLRASCTSVSSSNILSPLDELEYALMEEVEGGNPSSIEANSGNEAGSNQSKSSSDSENDSDQEMGYGAPVASLSDGSIDGSLEGRLDATDSDDEFGGHVNVASPDQDATKTGARGHDLDPMVMEMDPENYGWGGGTKLYLKC